VGGGDAAMGTFGGDAAQGDVGRQCVGRRVVGSSFSSSRELAIEAWSSLVADGGTSTAWTCHARN
jgi:hypothetical protein